MTNQSPTSAASFAGQAATAAANLKPGTWESVQALALLSIAESLIETRGL